MKDYGKDQCGVTAVILAGGMSRRLGRDKALEPFEGEPLVQRVISRMRQVGRSLLVVVNHPERAAELDLPDDIQAATDRYPGMGSLGGILTGLMAAPTEWSTFCACDMPFLSPRLYQHLLSQRQGYDAIVPVIDGRPEPTHAVYSRACIEPIRKRVIAQDLKISSFFGDVRVRLVPEDEVRLLDPDLRSFFNINTEKDLEIALEMVHRTPVP